MKSRVYLQTKIQIISYYSAGCISAAWLFFWGLLFNVFSGLFKRKMKLNWFHIQSIRDAQRIHSFKVCLIKNNSKNLKCRHSTHILLDLPVVQF